MLGIEVLTPEETERRSARAEEPLDLVSVSEAADLLGLTPGRPSRGPLVLRQCATSSTTGPSQRGLGWSRAPDAARFMIEAAAHRG